jgi:alkanesulfonate monooxygenase SsuD/methylene tetrahydromethanopterin reductase-like flavin-dependent oxidoreductase (luciferase family)
MKQIHLAAFLIAGPVAHSHALWRHPNTQLDFLQPDYYLRVAQTLEQGRFDLIFFADLSRNSGIREIYQGSMMLL